MILSQVYYNILAAINLFCYLFDHIPDQIDITNNRSIPGAIIQ
jgi:hypothetical protein